MNMQNFKEFDLDEARMSAAVRMQRAIEAQRAKSDASLRRTPSSIPSVPKKEEPKKQDVAEAFPNPGSGSTGSSKEDKRIAAALRKKHIPTTPNNKKEQGVAETYSLMAEPRYDLSIEARQKRADIAAKLAATAAKAKKKELKKEPKKNVKEEFDICQTCAVDPCICDDSHGFVTEAGIPKNHTIEAHGIRGMKATPWRKTFKNHEHLSDWADKNDSVEVHATRDLEQAKKGNLSPAMREEALSEGAAQHKVSVTVSEKDHPMVSKRLEKQQKRVIVSADSKEEAVVRAKKFYSKQGYHVHDAEYHSPQPKSTMKTESSVTSFKEFIEEESPSDKFKKYVRPVVKTTPKIERTTNPAGRTTDHVEWKVTTHTGEIHRHKTKKEAQDHFNSLPK